MDFPSWRYHKPTLSTLSLEMVATQLMALGVAAPASAVWPTANLAIYIPFVLAAPYPVKQVWWLNGATVTGNTDVGVYTPGGARLLSSGSTVGSGVSALQSVTLGTPVLLMPGAYYLGMSCSLGTNTIQRFSLGIADDGKMMGLAEQTTALPLPDPATFATYTRTYVPICGISHAVVL